MDADYIQFGGRREKWCLSLAWMVSDDIGSKAKSKTILSIHIFFLFAQL